MLPINYPVLILIALLTSIISRIRGIASSVSPKRIVQIRNSYWTYDGSKAKRELGFKAKVDIYDGIKEAVEDYLKEMDR